MSLFTLKYAPKNTSQVFGQQLPLAQLKDFITNYSKKPKSAKKAALLYGPIGTGKTSSVYALAKELDYDLLEINSSDLRDEASMKSFLGSALGQQSLFFRPKIVLIDEIDNISGKSDRGCLSALSDALEKSHFPVILTANDPFDSKFKDVRKNSDIIEYAELTPQVIGHALKWVCEQENIETEERAIQAIAHRSAGDLRGALIDLQVCSIIEDGKKKFNLDSVSQLSDRKRTDTVMNALMRVFKSSSAKTALNSMDDIDVDTRDIFSWIDENLPYEYTNPPDLARAYETFCRADIFQKRISKQQHWRFLAYIMDLLTAGISSAKDRKNNTFIQYQQSKRGLKIWMSRNKLAKREAITEKLAQLTHVSKRRARGEMPFVLNTLKTEAQSGNHQLIKELELSPEEVEWLGKG